MRVLITATFLAFGVACATRDPGAIRTEIVTFPDGAVVEYNGKDLGRAPAEVTLPQDSAGRLTGTAVIRLLPNTEQHHLYAQTRTFDPSNRTDRVPDRIMVDMTLPGTNAPAVQTAKTDLDAGEPQVDSKPRNRIPYTPRSKPTQAVGLDRWNPGKR